MPFPQTVREQCLVAAARHCCVCHRYKGLKIEVHHIIPEAEDGPNTFENAIVLCFDCHADAGHYNKLHPRGTRFAPTELRSARDAWYRMVADHKIGTPKDPNFLHCRFLICKNLAATWEIASGDLSEFPVKPPLLAGSPTFEFLRKVARSSAGDRNTRLWGRSFDSGEEYLKAYPYAKVISLSLINDQQVLEFERVPVAGELEEHVLRSDFISRTLVNNGVPVKEVFRLTIESMSCGRTTVHEEYQVRSLWSIFLAVTNSSEESLELECAEGTGCGGSFEAIRKFNDRSDDQESELSFPRAPLFPGETAILAVGVLIAPFDEPTSSSGWHTQSIVKSGEYQFMSHVFMKKGGESECLAWGPRFSVSKIRFSYDAKQLEQHVHELDLENVYVIDRSWMAGCCPHVFAVLRCGSVRYLGEIFTSDPGVHQESVVSIPEHCCLLVVAELEDEVTSIDEFVEDGEVVPVGLNLRKGEYWELEQVGSSSLTIRGTYRLDSKAVPATYKDRIRIGQLVEEFRQRLEETQIGMVHAK